jgi:hypothetical protein
VINSTNYLTPSSSLFPILVFTIFIVPFENSDIENHSYFFYVFKTKDQILIHKKKGKNQINEDHTLLSIKEVKEEEFTKQTEIT